MYLLKIIIENRVRLVKSNFLIDHNKYFKKTTEKKVSKMGVNNIWESSSPYQSPSCASTRLRIIAHLPHVLSANPTLKLIKFPHKDILNKFN